MDFDSALIEAGEFGPYQRKLFIVTNLLAFPISAQMLIMVFIAAKPEWSCSGSDKMCTDDGSICSNARFISNFTSLAGEWGLVCGQAYKVEALQSFFMFGNLLGAPVLGSLADSYGRKPVYMVCYIGTCATALISAFATSYNMFMILRFITGFFVGGGGLIVFVLTTESLGTKYRALMGSFQMMTFAVVLVGLGWLAYMITEWRYLLIASVMIAPLQILLFPSTPESMRWLVSKERYSEAEAILHKAASINNPHLKAKPRLKQVKQGGPSKEYGVGSFFTHAKTCKRLLNICQLFLVNSLVYYGISLNLKNLGGNLIVNFVIAGIVEIPANLLVIFTISRFGRRKSLFFFMISAALTCFVCMHLQNSDHPNSKLISFNAMIGKGLITSSFTVIYIYGSELLPTVSRNAGLGVASFANRVGGIMSPFIVLLGEKNKSFPMLTFALFSLVSGLLGATLPETQGKALPETFDDIENPHKKQSIKEGGLKA